MTFLDKLKGKKQVTTPEEAIQNLSTIEEMLTKKQEHLESKIRTEVVIIGTNTGKDKRLALRALRRKKRYEKQLKQIDDTLTVIEVQREALQAANSNVTVLKTMKNAADALKRTYLNIDVDMVQNVLDGVEDQQELANEISDAIASSVGLIDEEDEDELEKELEAIEDEILEKKLLELPRTPRTSNAKAASSSRVKIEKSAEEIKKLEDWAS